MYAGTPSGGNPLSPRGKHARNESRTAGDLVELRSLPEQYHGEPDLGPSTRTRLGQIANEPQRRSPARHRRDTPGPDALRARSAPMQDGTKTVPIPRLTYEAATGSVTGDTKMAGLEALLSISTLVQDVPAAVELPRVWRSATDGSENRHLAADEARAVDVLAAPSMRQSATVVALTRPAPAVRPPRSPAQRGPASYREPRRQVTSSGRHRSPVPVRGGFKRRTAQIVVILPAHNEQDYIGATIEGIQAQTRPADRIIVVPNNCRDDDETAVIAAKYNGVEVIELHGITGRKAGALNAALDVVLPDMADDDLVVCMDADTIIHPDLLANASAHFRLEPRLGAVSSNHLIKRHGTLIELLQAMEYERDRRFIGRRKGPLRVHDGYGRHVPGGRPAGRQACVRGGLRSRQLDRGLEADDRLEAPPVGHGAPAGLPGHHRAGLQRQGAVHPAGTLGARIHPDATPVRPHPLDRHPVGQAGWLALVGGGTDRAPVHALDGARSSARLVVPAGPYHPDIEQRQYGAQGGMAGHACGSGIPGGNGLFLADYGRHCFRLLEAADTNRQE